MATRSKSEFAEMVAACGLSQAEVAALTARSLSGIQKMFLGSTVPDDVTDALGVLFAEIESKARSPYAPDLPKGAMARREAILQLRRTAAQVKRASKARES